VPLVKLAVARSGDKGNHSNIGVIARHPDYLPWIAEALTPAVIVDWMATCSTRSTAASNAGTCPAATA
jgi:hypothetical protein